MEASFKRQLQKTACKVRLGALEAVYSGKSGHPGGSLSVADILTYLYFKELRVDPKNPQWTERDRFVLSKGHTCPALYAALALKGFFPWDELKNFRHPGAMLQGHPDMKHIPGVDMSTGSLGQGFSAACGMAIAAKLEQKDYRVYAVCGDGEIQEGQIWEAAMFAAQQKLDNVIAFTDYNKMQIDGTIDEICGLDPLDEKWRAFGWNVIVVEDGNDVEQIDDAINCAKHSSKPSMIILNTIKGKGISFVEKAGVANHSMPISKEEMEAGLAELGGVQ